MKVFAPGKIILSGEHAVVYGKPALAMAINRYAVASATPQVSKLISFNLADLAYQQGLTQSALHRLKKRIQKKYHHFMRGDYKIRDVLQKPFELAQFAFGLCLEMLNVKLTQGLKITMHSDIPIGCGMGSSAATILSIIHAISHYLKLELSAETFYHLGLEAENMQHGKSSGLDLRISLYGGCTYLSENRVLPRALPRLPLFFINTGTPVTSTGECVAAAATYFKNSTIAEDFAVITQAMDFALQQNNSKEITQLIKENHRLLSTIGVVPEKIKLVIAAIEQIGGAAKICGAGAIAGNHGGIVLAVTEDELALQNICQQFNYTILPISGESRGVHVI